jgi:hypothetical protein
VDERRRVFDACNRRDVDDSAAILTDHLLTGCGAAVKYAVQVQVDGCAPLFGPQFFWWFDEHRATRVVYQDIEATKLRNSGSYEFLDLLGLGNIAGQWHTGVAVVFDIASDIVQLGLIATGDNDLGALGSEGPRHAAANTACTSGDDYDLVFMWLFHDLVPTLLVVS